MTEQEHFNEMNEIRKKYEIVKDNGTEIPKPKDNKEAMEQLKGLYGATMCSIYKYHFFKDLGYRNEEAIKKAIKEKFEDLDKFIAIAEEQRITDKNNIIKRQEDLSEYDYYLRLKYDYYIDKSFHYKDVGTDTPIVKVYGTYFLFYDFLKAKLIELEQQKPKQKAVKDKITQVKPTPRQLAYCYYFKMESGEMERFGAGKIEKIKELCKEHSSKPGYAKNFELKLGEYSHPKNGKDNREKGTPHNIQTLQIVLEKLKDSPKALMLAEETLRIAENNKK